MDKDTKILIIFFIFVAVIGLWAFLSSHDRNAPALPNKTAKTANGLR